MAKQKIDDAAPSFMLDPQRASDGGWYEGNGGGTTVNPPLGAPEPVVEEDAQPAKTDSKDSE